MLSHSFVLVVGGVLVGSSTTFCYNYLESEVIFVNNLDNWILVVIAITSVISPIITAIINNRYQVKLKKIELEQQNCNQNTQRIIEILENYCKFTCNVLISHNVVASDNVLSKYSNYYGISILYMNDKDIEIANAIYQLICENKYVDANAIIDNHIISIRKTIDMLRKQRL